MHREHSGPIRGVTHTPMTTHKVTEVRNKQGTYSETSITDSFGTFPIVRLVEGVRLIEVVKIAQCSLTINIQRLL